MNAVIICYTLEKASQTRRTALKRELNGYKDFSNKGKYFYQRKGLLDKIPHIKPHNAVIISKIEHKSILLKVLKKHKAKIWDYEIQMEHPDLR